MPVRAVPFLLSMRTSMTSGLLANKIPPVRSEHRIILRGSSHPFSGMDPIADGPAATRGDFVVVDPNGSLLVTQSDEIDRLTPAPGNGFYSGTFHVIVTASAPGPQLE